MVAYAITSYEVYLVDLSTFGIMEDMLLDLNTILSKLNRIIKQLLKVHIRGKVERCNFNKM